jgi:hypothetical protein
MKLRHASGGCNLRINFSQQFWGKNSSFMRVIVQTHKKWLSSQYEYAQHDSANPRMSAKSPIMFHTQEVAGSNPASRTIFFVCLRGK